MNIEEEDIKEEGRKERDGRGIAWVHGVPGIPIGVVLHRTWFFFLFLFLSLPLTRNPIDLLFLCFIFLFLFLLCTWRSTLAPTLPPIHPEGSGIQMREGGGAEGGEKGLIEAYSDGILRGELPTHVSRILFMLTAGMGGMEWNETFER